MSNEFHDWYYSIPYFTRQWLTWTIVFSLLGMINYTGVLYFTLRYEPLVYQFQIWRPVTALFYFPTSFHFLVNCYFLYHYSRRLETGVFARKPADYIFMLLFNWVCCVTIGLLADFYVLLDPMVLSVLYVWCQINKNVVVSFWFGTRFKAMYLPWVLLVFNFIVHGYVIQELTGILIGHLAYFLIFKYPQELGGPRLLNAPAFLKRIYPDRDNFTNFAHAPTARLRGGETYIGAYNWGPGQMLGGN